MRAVVVSAALVGCSFAPSAVTGGGADAVADAIDAPIDGSPNVDTDGDGIVDALDNCPTVANADQRDWDGDHIGDACDHCPHLASATDPDTDGDGVGDACDPNPGTPGDRMIAFEGFAKALPNTWTIAGTFSVAAGDGSAKAQDSASTLVSIASPGSRRIEIRATAKVTAINAIGANLGAVSLVERLAPGTEKAIACQLIGLSNGTQEQLRIYDLSAGSVVDTAPHDFGAPLEIDLRLRRTDTTYACRATSPALELAGTDAFSPASPRIGLRVRGVDALFHWVMIVTSP